MTRNDEFHIELGTELLKHAQADYEQRRKELARAAAGAQAEGKNVPVVLASERLLLLSSSPPLSAHRPSESAPFEPPRVQKILIDLTPPPGCALGYKAHGGTVYFWIDQSATVTADDRVIWNQITHRAFGEQP